MRDGGLTSPFTAHGDDWLVCLLEVYTERGRLMVPNGRAELEAESKHLLLLSQADVLHYLGADGQNSQ